MIIIFLNKSKQKEKPEKILDEKPPTPHVIQIVDYILEVADNPSTAKLIFKNMYGERLYIKAANGDENICEITLSE